MSLFSGLRERYDADHPPAPRPTHLEADTLTTPVPNDVIPDSVPTFDAAHPFQLDGLWWTFAAATAKADADQKARALAAAKEAASTPVPAPPEPVVAPEPTASLGALNVIHPNAPMSVTTIATVKLPAPQPKETPMAAAPVPAPKETFGQKLHTVLDDLGNDFAKFGAWAVKEQPAAHAIIQEVGGTVSLFNPVAGAAILGGDTIAARIFAPVVAAQQAAAALGPTATGAQKLAYAAPMTAQILEQFPAIAGKTPSDLAAYQTKVTQVTSLLADILNLFPSTAVNTAPTA